MLVRSPAKASDLSLLQSLHSWSGVHPVTQYVPEGVFPGLKRPGRETDHSPVPANISFPTNFTINLTSYLQTFPHINVTGSSEIAFGFRCSIWYRVTVGCTLVRKIWLFYFGHSLCPYHYHVLLLTIACCKHRSVTNCYNCSPKYPKSVLNSRNVSDFLVASKRTKKCNAFL